MEPKTVLNLLDSYWYDLDFFTRSNPTDYNKIPENPTSYKSNQTTPTKLPAIHTKSTQIEKMNSISKPIDLSESPNSVLSPQNLQKTMFSCDEFDDSNSENPAEEEEEEENRVSKENRASKGRRVKSLSDLEFEEIKGFMDLGFVFNANDKDNSTLTSIIPGLQRLSICDEIRIPIPSQIQRPYLSESWENFEKRKKKKKIGKGNGGRRSWSQIPECSNQVDMKSYLKLWARSVASKVR